MGLSDLISYLIILGLLMLCSGFFSGSETALSALTRAQIQRMRRDRKKGNSAVVRFLDEPRRLFITVLFGNTLVNMAFVSIMGTMIYDDLFKGRNPGTAFIVAIFLETTLLLLLGEITPKTIAIRNAENFSRLVAPLLWSFSRFIFPFRKALRFFTDILLPLFGVHSMVDSSPITSAEIRATVKAKAEGGEIDKEEEEILSNIFELQETKAREVMIPRTKMVSVDVSSTIGEAFHKAMQEGYSRIPVYRKRLDNICGIFYAKDLPRWRNVDVTKLGKNRLEELTLDDFLSNQAMLNMLSPGQENTLIRQPYFVLNTRDIGSLLREMAHNKQQIALLLDEYGGVTGMVTAEDIAEEIVGEIEDEYDAAPDQKVTKDPERVNCYLVPGALGLRSLNRRLKLKLDIEQADTVSGYVTTMAGTIPQEGDILQDRFHRLSFEVLKMSGPRVELVRLCLKGKRPVTPVSLFLIFLSLSCFLGMSGSSLSISGFGESSGWIFPSVFGFLLVFSLIMSGFFSGTETAFVSASMARIEVLAQQSNRRALYIKRLMQEPDRMLGIVLVGTNLMNTAAGVAGLQLVRYTLRGREDLHEIVNTLVLTFVVLLFGELLPKTVFRAKSDFLALRSAPVLRMFDTLLRPFVIFFSKASNLIVRWAGKEDREERIRITREELRLLAEMGEEEGALKKEQLRMVHGILDLENRTIGKIMTPLIDIVALSQNTDPQAFFEKVKQTGFSRIPIYADRIDRIIGVVNVLDVLAAGSLPATIHPFIRRDIHHEPESRRVFPLLKELTRSRRPMVFVVDEYGGVVGLVTVEDLVEEVVGDIWEERDREEKKAIHRISDQVLDCDGKTEIQVLNHDYGFSLPEGEYNTIAGLIIERLQRIPKKGESLPLGKLKILVLDADAKSVQRVRIVRK
jgi:CBS domain containing-hemolysin-like protein